MKSPVILGKKHLSLGAIIHGVTLRFWLWRLHRSREVCGMKMREALSVHGAAETKKGPCRTGLSSKVCGRGKWPDGEVAGNKCVHSSFISVAMIPYPDQKQLQGETSLFALHFQVTGESRWELESASHLTANSSEGEKINAYMLPACLCLAACVLSSTVQDCPAKGMTLPTVGWAFHINSFKSTPPHRHAHRPAQCR